MPEAPLLARDSVDAEELLGYLDTAIQDWRDVRDFKVAHRASQAGIAPYYVDAYQSARASIFGVTLP